MHFLEPLVFSRWVGFAIHKVRVSCDVNNGVWPGRHLTEDYYCCCYIFLCKFHSFPLFTSLFTQTVGFFPITTVSPAFLLKFLLVPLSSSVHNLSPSFFHFLWSLLLPFCFTTSHFLFLPSSPIFSFSWALSSYVEFYFSWLLHSFIPCFVFSLPSPHFVSLMFRFSRWHLFLHPAGAGDGQRRYDSCLACGCEHIGL